MNKVQKIDYVKEVSKNLEQNHVFELFERLTRDLIVHQPENPIEFLIKKLKNPPGKRMFITGPPGSGVRELTLQLSDHFETEVVSVGDLLVKEVNKKTEVGEKIDKYIKNMLYVPDDIVFKVLKENLDSYGHEKNVIVEGYPKTAYQSMALVRSGIIPDLFVLVNYSQKECENFSKHKFGAVKNEESRDLANDELWGDITDSDRSQRSLEYLSQYQLNIKDLKLHYKNNLIEIAGGASSLNDLAPLIRFKIQAKSERKLKVLIFGPPGSGKKSLAKELSHKFGFVVVSINSLLLDQIQRKTEVGQEICDSYKAGKLVSDEIVYGLLKNRLEKADCRLNGFVLEGFPKNENQIKMMDQLEFKLKPNFFVRLKLDDDMVHQRISNRLIDQTTLKKYSAEEAKQLPQEEALKLTPIPTQTKEVVTLRLTRWKELDKVLDEQSGLDIFSINSNQPMSSIVEKVVNWIGT